MVFKDNSTVVELEVSSKDIVGVETMVKGITAAIFYGICSVSSAFVTKALMDTLDFDFPVIIMVAQMAFTIVVVESLNAQEIISIPKYTLNRGLSFVWPSLFYGLNSVLSLSALAHMNIAMYGVLKRCVPISTMILSVCILHQSCPSQTTMITVFMLSIGCVIAGYGDLTFNPMAYLCGTLSNFTQALYLLLVQRITQHERMSVTETLQLNCYNTLPFLILVAAVKGELTQVWHYDPAKHPYFSITFFFTIGVGMLLNYSLFLCTGLTSALTTSVVGGLKAMVQTILGLVTFGGVSHNAATYIGITLNLLGGVGYIAAKYNENDKMIHKGLQRTMIFSSTSSSQVSGEKDNMMGDLIPSVNENLPNGYHTKERHPSECSSGGEHL